MIKQWVRNTYLYRPLRAVYRFVSSILKSIRNRIQYLRMKQFYGQFINKGSLCFDLGANIGSRTNVFLKLGAGVVAVEPQPECVKHLQNLKHSQLKIVQAAVGAEEGQQEMVFAKPNVVSTLSKEFMDKLKDSGVCKGIKWGQPQQVRVTSLSALMEEYGKPDFIKIDVEGYEYQVLQGLKQPVPVLSLEFHSLHLEPALQSIAYLDNLGEIQLNYTLFEHMQLKLEQWVSPETMYQVLEGYRSSNKLIAGDVYVRFINY